MSPLKRPSRLKNQGLTFSSSFQKRRRSISPNSIPSKRIHVSPTPETTMSSLSSIAPTENEIKTRILVISDTHGVSKIPQPISQNHKIDIVLHCGDLSECGTLKEYKNTISLLESIPAPLKLVIPGNHDLTLDLNFWEANCTEEGKNLHDQARELWTSPPAKEAGIELLDEGTHSFVLDNGAVFKIYASPYTVNNQGVREWGFGYASVEDRFNLEGEGVSYAKATGTEESVMKSNEEVDVVMTHGPAKYRLDLSSDSESLGYPHLFRAIRRFRPKVHVFRHVHNAYGAEAVRWRQGREMPEDDDVDDGIETTRKIEGFVEDGARPIEVGKGNGREETLFVNAALMGRDEELENLPWLVELELERAST